MPKINLPIANGFYETDSPVISSQNCVNMYPVTEGVDSLAADTLRSIPGCLYVDDTGGTLSTDVCVGGHVLNGTPYFVIGAALWKLSSSGVLSNVGSLTNDGRPTMANNGTQLMICFPGSNGYIFTEDPDTLTLISDADYTTTNGAPQAVVFIDGYFCCTTNGSKHIISSPNDGLTWNPLDFGTAESSPDATVTPVVYRNQLFVAGKTTLEAFSNLGGTDYPFVRTGLFLDKGIYSPQTVVNAPDTFVFIGAGEDEIPAVWKFENNSTVKISNRGIDKLLREMTTAELDNIYSWAYGQSGNYFIGFTLTDTCIVYDLTTGKWHERLSDYTPGASDGETCSPYSCSAFTDGQIAAGFDYQWLLNDKHTNYQGVMDEEVSSSTILSAIGSVDNTGEDASTVFDACSGITGWRVRPTGGISNSSELRVIHPTATTLLTDGFSFAAAMMPTSEIPSGVLAYSYQYTGGHTVAVSVNILDANTLQVDVTSTGTISPYTINVTLAETIVVSTPQMIYVEYDNTQIKLYFGSVLLATHVFTNGAGGAAQALPLPSGGYTGALFSLFKNSQYLLQNIALGSTISASELESLLVSFQRNYSEYVVPAECFLSSANYPWRSGAIVAAYGKIYSADRNGPWVCELTPDAYQDTTDAIFPIRRVWTTQPFQNNMQTMFVPSIELTIESGTGDATTLNPMITLEISRDGGRTFEAGRERPIGAGGVYTSRAIWRRCGRFDRFSVFRFSTNEPVRVTAVQLTADVVGGR